MVLLGWLSHQGCQLWEGLARMTNCFSFACSKVWISCSHDFHCYHLPCAIECEICWRKVPGKFAGKTLLASLAGKVAREVLEKIPGNFAGENLPVYMEGKVVWEIRQKRFLRNLSGKLPGNFVGKVVKKCCRKMRKIFWKFCWENCGQIWWEKLLEELDRKQFMENLLGRIADKFGRKSQIWEKILGNFDWKKLSANLAVKVLEQIWQKRFLEAVQLCHPQFSQILH